MLRAALLALAFQVTSASACETALLLAMDVSNSVDPGEFRLQTDGLAAALRDPEIAEILVRDRVALAVLQWSGEDRQELSIPWTRIRGAAQVAGMAAQVQSMERAFVLSNTAPAEAVRVAIAQFRDVADCERQIIDVSGDGTPNAGGKVSTARQAAERAGITVNGLAIEGLGVAITNFYRGQVITRDGFVITARGHRDYARAIRIKILREISRVIGDAGHGVAERRRAGLGQGMGPANAP